jgi:hypothetical protein
MISKSSIALLFLALTSYVNAAAIAPRVDGESSPGGQFLLGLVRRTLLTSDLGARDVSPGPSMRLALRAAALTDKRSKFLFLSRGRLC